MQDLVFENTGEIITDSYGSETREYHLPPPFYVPPNNYRLLIQFNQFIASNEKIALLVGSKSSGKSTLLKLFEEKEKTTVCVHHPNKEKLNVALSCLFPHGEAGFSNATIERLLSRINELDNDLYLMVDDADDLPVESIQKLITLFTYQEGIRHKLFLAGGLSLVSIIEAICARNDINIPTTNFRLEPLCIDGTKEFIEKTLYYLTSTEMKKMKKEIKRIHELSEGYPGRINRVTLQIMTEDVKPKAIISKPKKRKLKDDLLLTIAIISVLSTVGYKATSLYLENRTNNNKAIISNKKNMHSPAKQQAPITVQPSTHNLSSYEEAMPSYIASIENLPEQVIVSPKAEVNISFQPVVSAAIDALASKRQLKTPPVQVTAASATTNGYTVQVMAADQWQGLVLVANKLKLNDQFKIHFIKRQNKSWYVLTYGQFANYNLAKQAIKQLPTQLQSEKPWVRSLKAMS